MLRSTDPVAVTGSQLAALESWTHLEVFKEHYARSLDVRG
ncbi:hypothetical protein Rhow_004176 [Rhodococcus wratislaviensis]|uniref:Uncharacterized protein n=1 Tax=Rhodococcus wratislaviensis TaxID=44752 RepID=A0A402CAD1_RHOWR|nr:hypothetical protein Rhow_004176 [Rhodococcus wratislaviensis]